MTAAPFTSSPVSFGISDPDEPRKLLCEYRAQDEPKACCHPILTPAGHCLTSYRPSDHTWHRGLWFALKYINETNFWEEDEAVIGHQKTSAFEQSQGEMKMRIEWSSQTTGAVLREKRRLVLGESDPGVMALDWQSDLTALKDLHLDRTPYTTWGGYSGLGFRGSRQMLNGSFFTDEIDPSENGLPAGTRAPWCALHAQMDGGLDQWITIAFLDHPENTRNPVPWYCRSKPGNTFINAALLFHEPLRLREGERLRCNYRILWADGKLSRDQIAHESAAYSFSGAGDGCP